MGLTRSLKCCRAGPSAGKARSRRTRVRLLPQALSPTVLRNTPRFAGGQKVENDKLRSRFDRSHRTCGCPFQTPPDPPEIKKACRQDRAAIPARLLSSPTGLERTIFRFRRELYWAA